MAKYKLLTLSAERIVSDGIYQVIKQDNGIWKVLFKFDLSEKVSYDRDIILHKKGHEDNALFYQLRQCFDKTANKETEEKELLKSYIVFIDFKTVFTRNIDICDDYENKKADELKGDSGLGYRLRWMFDPNNGIQLSFDGYKYKTFVPFDKSSSMARNSVITFIDKDLKDIIDRRLLLDIDFSKTQVVSSKYYNYRGLYMSTGYRIEQDNEFSLNHETVIVIPDMKYNVSGNIFTAKETVNDNTQEDSLWSFFEIHSKNSLKTFDGEGLICPEYAFLINKQLTSPKYKFKKESHSFQVRMPFTKGLLHEVDFNKYIAEQLSAKGGVVPDQLLIEDIFHIKRDLKKAKIIMTKSMFKCCDWLTKLLYSQKTAFSDNYSDPMKYFFEKMTFYRHTLYITNTDTRLSSTGKVPLNSQFLSTLNISYEDFNSIINDHIEWTKSIPHLFDCQKEAVRKFINELEDFDKDKIVNNNNNEQSSEQDKENQYNSREKCLKALALNNAFLKETKIRNIINDIQKDCEMDLCLGNIAVRVEQRYLSCDLLELLRFIYQNITNVTMDCSQLLELRRQRLYSNHFYMPERRIRMKADKFYGILRNPHLARNEQCLLRPYVKAGSLYEKYFSHLKGIIMLSCESLAPMALGGADFDGDLVKIISDRRIVDAIKSSGYNETKKNVYEKTLPVIKIPSKTPPPEEDKGSIPFKTVKNTFANQVGQISNKAIKIAKKEYGPEGIPKEDAREGKCCAGCTIVTGLEIDAAKTGKHPNANIAKILSMPSGGRNVYLDVKKALEGIALKHFSLNIKNANETNQWNDVNESEIKLSLYLNKDKKPFLKDIPVFNKEDHVPNLDRLPGEYLRFLLNETKAKINAENKKPRNRIQGILFKFQKDKNWKTMLDEDKLTQIKKLIEAYIKIDNLGQLMKENKEIAENRNYTGHVNTILKIQYDSLSQMLPCGIEVAEARNQAYATIKMILENSLDVLKAIKRLKDEKWHYTPPEKRKLQIIKILGMEMNGTEPLVPAVIELLSDFRNNGYMLFFYILKDIQNDYDVKIETDIFIEKETLKRENYQNTSQKTDLEKSKKANSRYDFSVPKDNPYYQDLYKKYSSLSADKDADWKHEIELLCHKETEKLLGSDMNMALQYVYATRDIDKSHRFLWNIFTKEEILKNVYEPESL